MIRVRITEPCFVGGGLRTAGSECIVLESEFSDACMVDLSKLKPEPESMEASGESEIESAASEDGDAAEETDAPRPKTRKRVVKKKS